MHALLDTHVLFQEKLNLDNMTHCLLPCTATTICVGGWVVRGSNLSQSHVDGYVCVCVCVCVDVSVWVWMCVSVRMCERGVA